MEKVLVYKDLANHKKVNLVVIKLYQSRCMVGKITKVPSSHEQVTNYIMGKEEVNI